MSADGKLRIGLLWHMHQPFYFNPEIKKLEMPWVRLHGLKDYLDMPLLASQYENVKPTFNLVPSLLDQIDMYGEGITDLHYDLSMIPARELEPQQKKEILKSFFSVNYRTMIEPNVRYRQLFKKKETCGNDMELAQKIFSTGEWLDLQVWSSLAWVDRMFHNEEPIKSLFDKGRDYTEDDKRSFFEFQLELLSRIIPTYKDLYENGSIDISFTPYYHPILPLLVDSESAREALSDIELPDNRYRYPEDAEAQINKSFHKFKGQFGRKPAGMWPSEGSISEPVLKLIKAAGFKWVASDEEVLKSSLLKSKMDTKKYTAMQVYEYSGTRGLKTLFRERGLSDKVGFVYSSWKHDRAVADFIDNCCKLKSLASGNVESSVIPIILDGENAWEYYDDDGNNFLTGLYQRLNDSREFKVDSMERICDSIKAVELPSVCAGSWINHNFKIWIGHPEDNAAWDLLFMARKTVEKFEKNNPDADKKIIRKAWEQIYIAEGSDWCWWYGDEHIGSNNEKFDELFRGHLRQVYNILEIEPPAEFYNPIYKGRQESFLSAPESLITPELDGFITHYYEWSGAGHYQCRRAGQAMHRTDSLISDIYFAFDYDRLYIRLDFEKRFPLVDVENYSLALDFDDSGSFAFPGFKSNKDAGRNTMIAVSKVAEIGLARKILAPDGKGMITLRVLLYKDNKILEKWPVDNSIKLDLPEKDKEIFWQV